MSDYFESPYKNRDSSYTMNYENYTINLMDLSVIYENKKRYIIVPSLIPHNRFR